ncbi:hypothetical protein A0H81_02951 [Grifola frondosa]|uniref:Uncharacterized protein n=1 Tax=Grifola frondosa TaxID=5627 RepID=A0A1C7MIR0_GRIFR|nr:hypothetical protein A0H81_02951 [Grifola frondosa]
MSTARWEAILHSTWQAYILHQQNEIFDGISRRYLFPTLPVGQRRRSISLRKIQKMATAGHIFVEVSSILLHTGRA